MTTEQRLFDRLDKLLVFRKGDQRAPHKPLYLLFCIAGLQLGKPRLHTFRDVQSSLKRALRLFGPRTASVHPEYPFWHLQRDQLAELITDAPLVMRRASVNPTVSSLLAGNARGGFSHSDYVLLRGNLALQSLISHKILDSHFPSSIHEDIVRYFGLTLDQPHAQDKISDIEFRNKVIRAYQNKCALTGFELMFEENFVGLEASHIFWPQAGGNDEVSNGIAMTSLHRKLFHLGLFTTKPDDLSIITSPQAMDHGKSLLSLSKLAGQKITLPNDKFLWPSQTALSWHKRWVFRG